MGYAAPGTVIAIGILVLAGGFDRLFNQFTSDLFGFSAALMLIGTGGAVVYAYVVRFLAISAGGIDSGLERIPLSLDHASRTLGRGVGRRSVRFTCLFPKPRSLLQGFWFSWIA